MLFAEIYVCLNCDHHQNTPPPLLPHTNDIGSKLVRRNKIRFYNTLESYCLLINYMAPCTFDKHQLDCNLIKIRSLFRSEILIVTLYAVTIS